VKEKTLQVVETARQLPVRPLAAIAVDYSSSARLEEVPGPPPGERTSARVHRSTTYDIWLIRWGAGSQTVLHDHGGSAGALYVVEGDLIEHHPHPAGFARPLRRELRERDHRPMPRHMCTRLPTNRM
jgi:hypothetical protein